MLYYRRKENRQKNTEYTLFEVNYMKKNTVISAALAALLLLSGCQNQPQATTSPLVDTTLPPVTTEFSELIVPPSPNPETVYSISMPITTEADLAEDGTEYFHYSYQTMNLTVPDREVADKVIIDFLSRVESTREDAGRIHDLAQAAYTARTPRFQPYFYQIQYNPARIDQGVLSLFGQIVTVSDAGHASTESISANYNMVTGDVLTLGSILYQADRKEDIAQLVIKDLESREELALYDDFRDTVRDRFRRDESTDEDFYFSSYGLCFYFSPYEIAPYVYGTVEVEIPYNKLTGLIGDEFFPDERILSSGHLNAMDFDKADLQDYDQFAEIVVDSGADMVLLTADSTLQDIKILQLIWTKGDATYTQTKTIFASNVLTAQNAILLEADFSSNQPPFLITYLQNGELCSRFLAFDAATREYTLTK